MEAQEQVNTKMELFFRFDDSQEMAESSIEADPLNDDNRYKWTEEQTKFILEMYEINRDKVGTLNEFRLKKQMWQHIADATSNRFGISVSWSQVESKYKGVKRRTKKSRILECFNEPQQGPKAKKIQLDGSGLPQLVMSPGRRLKQEAVSTVQPKSPSVSPTRTQSHFSDDNEIPRQENIQTRKTDFERVADKMLAEKRSTFEKRKKLLLYLHQKKEASKQRRHEEKMKLFERLIMQNDINFTDQ